eukprot:360277-Chlamydomonas_euryale.AAC.5
MLSQASQLCLVNWLAWQVGMRKRMQDTSPLTPLPLSSPRNLLHATQNIESRCRLTARTASTTFQTRSRPQWCTRCWRTCAGTQQGGKSSRCVVLVRAQFLMLDSPAALAIACWPAAAGEGVEWVSLSWFLSAGCCCSPYLYPSQGASALVASIGGRHSQFQFQILWPAFPILATCAGQHGDCFQIGRDWTACVSVSA